MGYPKQCLACGTPTIKTQGFGTQKIEDEIQALFPEQHIKRLDLDTTRNKQAADELLYQFDQGAIDILIGTQIITKGLDFKNVGLVGILNADNLLNYPDFRAEERSFQLMLQVSGRAGREKDKGTVVLQTSQTQHPVIKDVISSDYLSMYQRQINERQEFAYPPFVRLIEITIKHKLEQHSFKGAQLLTQELHDTLPHLAILGPQAPVINRIQNMYLQTILIKVPKNNQQRNIKEIIQSRIDNIQTQAAFRSLRIHINVDPF
jgi:primosomal protein N' (replication factor Y)